MHFSSEMLYSPFSRAIKFSFETFVADRRQRSRHGRDCCFSIAPSLQGNVHIRLSSGAGGGGDGGGAVGSLQNLYLKKKEKKGSAYENPT